MMSKKSPFHIEVAGMDLIQNLMSELPNVLGETMDEVTEKHTLLIVGEAKRIVPVNTGHLKSSIFARRESPDKFTIVAAAPYAAYVEFGTVKMNAQPYLRPSVHKQMPAYIKEMRDNALVGIRGLISRLISRAKKIRR